MTTPGPELSGVVLWKHFNGLTQATFQLTEQSGFTLSGMAQFIGHRSAKQKVAGLIPGQVHAWVAGSVPGRDMCERQPTDVSLSHQCFSPSLSPSLPLPKSK